MITPKNLVRHELIGLKCKIIKAADISLIGTEGEVVDETKNTLVLECGRKEKRIPKKDATFIFILPECSVQVDGKMLVGRPEDRIKL